uniref:Protein-lysine N-methyltransferase n=1 Tax=Meloidogyne hapla TaxID=6305 RepID=A0A1I8BVS3_MELHA
MSLETKEDFALSPETLAILNEFIAEKSLEDVDVNISEDWQLSQFWYTSDTSLCIVNECLGLLEGEIPKRIACISCPSLIAHFMKAEQFKQEKIEVKLFEYDKRFQQRYPTSFIHYDYRNPLNIDKYYSEYFDFIIADPPFLSDECFIKVAQTIRILAKPKFKLIFCTGTIMEDLLKRLFNLRRANNFRPEHNNNLANDFSLFLNYESKNIF